MARINGCVQGSVLSPIPLLQGLEANHLGPTLCDIYIEAFSHADDIRTITSNLTTLKQQVKFVQDFCADNALTLNLSKCEVLAVYPTKPPLTSSLCTFDNQHPLIPRESVKCPGYWWSWDLSSAKSIHEAISKARRAFLLLAL